MNQSGIPLNLEDPDAILKHIIKTEAEDKAEDNHRILRSQKKSLETKSLGIKGNGWKLD